MEYSLWDFFSHPLLRASTLGSMLLCCASSLLGVFVFVRKKALVGETLSHASYPGLMVGALLVYFFPCLGKEEGFFAFIGGAFVSVVIALFFLESMQRRFRVKSDAALCFVLSSFFGVGVLLASRLQTLGPVLYRQTQIFLYGQVATMTDQHVLLYGVLTGGLVLFIACVYPWLRILCFDRAYARSWGFSLCFLEGLLSLFLAFAIVLGMKSVGVVLLSGMLIGPPLAAREWSSRLGYMLAISAIVGSVCGFLGNYFSLLLSSSQYVLPAGPLIVLCSFMGSMGSVLFAPKRGRWMLFMQRRRFARLFALEGLLRSLVCGEKVEACPLLRLAYRKGLVVEVDGVEQISSQGRQFLEMHGVQQ